MSKNVVSREEMALIIQSVSQMFSGIAAWAGNSHLDAMAQSFAKTPSFIMGGPLIASAEPSDEDVAAVGLAMLSVVADEEDLKAYQVISNRRDLLARAALSAVKARR